MAQGCLSSLARLAVADATALRVPGAGRPPVSSQSLEYEGTEIVTRDAAGSTRVAKQDSRKVFEMLRVPSHHRTTPRQSRPRDDQVVRPSRTTCSVSCRQEKGVRPGDVQVVDLNGYL